MKLYLHLVFVPEISNLIENFFLYWNYNIPILKSHEINFQNIKLEIIKMDFIFFNKKVFFLHRGRKYIGLAGKFWTPNFITNNISTFKAKCDYLLIRLGVEPASLLLK